MAKCKKGKPCGKVCIAKAKNCNKGKAKTKTKAKAKPRATPVVKRSRTSCGSCNRLAPGTTIGEDPKPEPRLVGKVNRRKADTVEAFYDSREEGGGENKRDTVSSQFMAGDNVTCPTPKRPKRETACSEPVLSNDN